MENKKQPIGQNLHGRDVMNAAEFRLMNEERNKKGGKFNNKPVIIDGIRFDSTLEGKYYGGLKMRKLGGDIKGFSRQVTFKLIVNGVFISEYRADFVIENNDGTKTVVDTKSEDTEKLPAFRMKEKLMLALYGIKILIAK